MGDFRSVDLLTLNEKSFPDREERIHFRVVQWIYQKKDGTMGSSVKLENSLFYMTKPDAEGEREERFKSKGLNIYDMEKLKEHWGEIIRLMKNPPEIKEPEPKQEQGGGTGDLEDIPFY